MIRIGTIVPCGSEEKIIAEIGDTFSLPCYSGWWVSSVRFDGGSFGIVLCCKETGVIYEWIPDRDPARYALRGAIAMLKIELGKIPDVLYVRGKDPGGEFFAKLFGSKSKKPPRRSDELYRGFF